MTPIYFDKVVFFAEQVTFIAPGHKGETDIKLACGSILSVVGNYDEVIKRYFTAVAIAKGVAPPLCGPSQKAVL